MKSAEKVEPDERARRVHAALSEAGYGYAVAVTRADHVDVDVKAHEQDVPWGGAVDGVVVGRRSVRLLAVPVLGSPPQRRPCPHDPSSWWATAPSLRRPAHREDAP